MFERLIARGHAMAEGRRRGRVLALTDAMTSELPHGVSAEAGEEGVTLSGRGLSRRIVWDEALRWLTARVR